MQYMCEGKIGKLTSVREREKRTLRVNDATSYVLYLGRKQKEE